MFFSSWLSCLPPAAPGRKARRRGQRALTKHKSPRLLLEPLEDRSLLSVLTFTSTDVPKAIPDNLTAGITSNLNVLDSFVIGDINVTLDITHPYDADLDVYLRGPDGTRVMLFTDVGSSGDNFSKTTLDDEASPAITAASAPFTGSFRPEELLNAFVGKNVQGVWTLEIADDSDRDVGTLLGWSLSVTAASVYTSTNVPLRIPATGTKGTIVSTLTVPDSYAIQDLNVVLDITHTYDADLNVYLRSPDGTQVELFTKGGGSGDNFTNTTLDDGAGRSITSVSAPFTGSFRPEGLLSALVGKNIGGTWTLQITDDTSGDYGQLIRWSLIAERDYVRPPDLVGVSLVVNEIAALPWGSTFTVSYKIKNQGGTLAGPFSLQFLLSGDSFISSDDVSFGYLNNISLAAQAEKSSTVELRLPNNPGNDLSGLDDVFIGLLIDPSNRVAELDETNNANRGDGIDRDGLEVIRLRETEPNDTPDGANKVHFNYSLDATLSSPADVDVYKITVSQPGFVEIWVEPWDGSTLDSRLTLASSPSFFTYDGLRVGGGDLLSTSDDRAPDNPNPYLRQFLQTGFRGPGIYFVAVSSGRPGDSGAYRLTTTFCAADDPLSKDRLPSRVPVGINPQAIVVSDFNRDGNLDLATANQGSGDVSVMLGIGDGTFQPAIVVDVPDHPTTLAIHDFNNDGRPDLITMDSTTRFVSLIPGIGDGSFATARLIRMQVPDPVDALALADLNQDGLPDLVTLDRDAKRVTVFLGRSEAGRFDTSPLVHHEVPDDSTRVTFVDYDRDTLLDLAVLEITTEYSGGNIVQNGYVSVLRGLGNGTFDATPLARLPYRGPLVDHLFDRIASGRVLGDFNRDGNLDVAKTVAVVENGTVVKADYLIIQPTFPTTGQAIAYVTVDTATGRSTIPHPVEPGLIEAVLNSADLFDRGDYPYWNSPNPSRATPLPADLNGDRTPDVLIVSESGDILFRPGQSGQPVRFDTAIRINDRIGRGDPGAHAVAVLAEGPHAVVAALDLDQARVSLYSRGASDLVWTRTAGPELTGLSVRIVAGDLDRDGYTDLVIGNPILGAVAIYCGQTGGLRPVPLLIKVGISLSDVVLTDVNRDGWLDVLATNQVSGDVSVLINRTPQPGSLCFRDELRFRADVGDYGVILSPLGGHFNTLVWNDNAAWIPAGSTFVPFPDHYYGFSRAETSTVAAADFTGDGVVDLVAANRGSGSITLLLGKSGGSFVDPQIIALLSKPIGLAVADFDEDGKQDLAILNEDTATIAVLLNKGHGDFAGAVTLSAGHVPTGLTVRDLNNDGKWDLLIGNRFGDLLVLTGDGRGNFAVPRPPLQEVPLAVQDLNGDHLPDVVLASQDLDRVWVRFRQPGSKNFSDPVFEDSNSINRTLLAPGAVQLIRLDGDSYLDLVVASTLANKVLVYRGLGNGQFSAPLGYDTGTQPVAVTARDLNGDGVLDLIVANKGSNDVSVLMGQWGGGIGPRTAEPWTAVANFGLRLASGGQGPLGVDVSDPNGDGIPDLVVTNSSGEIVALPGIAAGSGNQGSGFFRDLNPTTVNLGQPILQAPRDNFLPTQTGIFSFDPRTFTWTPVIALPRVAALEVGRNGTLLVTALTGGRVDRFERGIDGEFHLTGTFPGLLPDVSALELLESEGAFEIYLTQEGRDLPRILTEADFQPMRFVSLATESVVAGPEARSLEALAVSLPGIEVALVAVLVIDAGQGGVQGSPADETAPDQIPGEVQEQLQDTDNQGQDEEQALNQALSSGAEERLSPLEALRLGLDEAFRRLLEELPADEGAKPRDPNMEPLPDEPPLEMEEPTGLSIGSLHPLATLPPAGRASRQSESSTGTPPRPLPLLGRVEAWYRAAAIVVGALYAGLGKVPWQASRATQEAGSARLAGPPLRFEKPRAVREH